MFTLRFDMRSSAEGATFRDLYSAALDMCEWSEKRGELLRGEPVLWPTCVP